MFIATATFKTPHGAKYIAQLCKHFSHKVDTHVDGNHGSAALPTGPMTVQATDDSLSIRVEAGSPEDIIQAKYVVDKHLAIFAFREPFTGFNWQVEQVNTAT